MSADVQTTTLQGEEAGVWDPSIAILLGYSLPLYLIAVVGEPYFAERFPLRRNDGDDEEDKEHTTTEDYLTFLVMCRNLFCVLTVLSVPVVSAVWGFQHFLFFLPRGSWFHVAVDNGSADDQSGSIGIMLMIWITVFHSFIAFCFVARYQRDTQFGGSVSLRESQALWLSNIPIRDQATLQRHELTLEDFQDQVAKDLWDAISHHLTHPRKRSKDNSGSWRESAAVCPLDFPTCNCFLLRCTLGVTVTCSCCPCLEGRLKGGLKGEATEAQEGQVESLLQPNTQSASSESFIEELVVQPVMSSYIQASELYESIKYADEMVQVYEKLHSESLQIDRDTIRKSERLKEWWYNRQKIRWQDALKNRWKRFQAMKVEALPMSGHAFVVFTSHALRNAMLEPKREWWETRDHAYFKFGRPPFSSVTLQARHAPHPSDVIWRNLHIGACPTVCGSAFHISVMIVVTIVVVFLIAVSSQLDNFVTCSQGTSGARLSSAAELICGVVVRTKKRFVTEQVPTVLLLSFNSLILPYWIDIICQRMACYTITSCELNQLALNLIVLVLSKFVVPFVSLAALSLVSQDGLFANTILDLIDIPRSAMQDAGMFYLKYSLNCAFFTTGFGLLQIGRHLYRLLVLAFSARTRTECEEAEACLAFPWGYWYAWSLSLAANGLITGVMVPSMLPVTALTFALKYQVDQKLLEQDKAFNPGPDTKGFFPPYITHYMYNIIAVKVMFMAILSLLAARHSGSDWGSQGGKEVVYVYVASLSLLVLSLGLLSASSWSKLQFSLNANCAADQETCLQKAADLAVYCWDKFLHTFREAKATSKLGEPLLDGKKPKSFSCKSDAEWIEKGVSKDANEARMKVMTWDARKNILAEILADRWPNFRGLADMDDAFDELDLVLPGDEDLQKGKRALRTKLCQIFGFTGGEKMVRKQAIVKRTWTATNEASFVPSPLLRARMPAFTSQNSHSQTSARTDISDGPEIEDFLPATLGPLVPDLEHGRSEEPLDRDEDFGPVPALSSHPPISSEGSDRFSENSEKRRSTAEETAAAVAAVAAASIREVKEDTESDGESNNERSSEDQTQVHQPVSSNGGFNGSAARTTGEPYVEPVVEEMQHACDSQRSELEFSEEPLPVLPEGDLEESRASDLDILQSLLPDAPAIRVTKPVEVAEDEVAYPEDAPAPRQFTRRPVPLKPPRMYHPILATGLSPVDAEPPSSPLPRSLNGAVDAGLDRGTPRTPVSPLLTPVSSAAPSSIGARSLPDPRARLDSNDKRGLVARRAYRGSNGGMGRMRSVPLQPIAAGQMKARRRSKEAEDIQVPTALRRTTDT
mmetsp:Transcript_12951/g.29343  ORF Transcript_12951/g.29343 Transcript_12951/m.29343 type:complete len:1324 (-) Transcript_12951:90-4061(-)